MARPRKEVDKRQFENLCGLHCTKQEICGWFELTDKTLENAVKCGKDWNLDIIVVRDGDYLPCRWSEIEYFQSCGGRYIGTVYSWYQMLECVFEGE